MQRDCCSMRQHGSRTSTGCRTRGAGTATARSRPAGAAALHPPSPPPPTSPGCPATAISRPGHTLHQPWGLNGGQRRKNDAHRRAHPAAGGSSNTEQSACFVDTYDAADNERSAWGSVATRVKLPSKQALPGCAKSRLRLLWAESHLRPGYVLQPRNW